MIDIAVYGLKTYKRSPSNEEFSNSYRIEADTIVQALGIADVIALAEAEIHSDIVTIYKHHIWQSGQPFNTGISTNLNYTGVVASTNPLKSQIVARVLLNTSVGKGGYKDYRVQCGSGFIQGFNWLSGMTNAYDSFELVIAPVLERLMVGNSNVVSMTFDEEYQFHNTYKRWYNRAT